MKFAKKKKKKMKKVFALKFELKRILFERAPQETVSLSFCFSVSQTKRFKELHISETSPPEPQNSGMSTTKAKSARKQGSESELARSAKKNRVEEEFDFDLDLSKLVYHE